MLDQHECGMLQTWMLLCVNATAVLMRIQSECGRTECCGASSAVWKLLCECCRVAMNFVARWRLYFECCVVDSKLWALCHKWVLQPCHAGGPQLHIIDFCLWISEFSELRLDFICPNKQELESETSKPPSLCSRWTADFEPFLGILHHDPSLSKS